MKSKIGIMGIIGSFHQEAANTYFGEDIDLVECKNFLELSRKIFANEIDFGVMASRNTIAGEFREQKKLIEQFNLKIEKQIDLPISLNLLAIDPIDLNEIKKIYAHPHALSQCKFFIEQHKEIEFIESGDSASCARLIKLNADKTAASIGNVASAKIYNLNILQTNIQDELKNFTGFYILSNKNNLVKENTILNINEIVN